MAVEETSVPQAAPLAAARREPDVAGRAGARWSRVQWALFWVLLILWLAVLGIAGAAALVFRDLYQGDQILPGVSSLGLDLSYRSPDRAAGLLQDLWQSRTIRIESGGAEWELTPDRLGLVLDASATAQLAYQQGRALDFSDLEAFRVSAARLAAAVPEYLQQLGVPLKLPSLDRITGVAPPVELAPVWKFDQPPAAAVLRAIADQLYVPPTNATLRIANGRVETTAGVKGQALNLAAAQVYVEEHPWQVFLERKVPISVVPLSPTVPDLNALASRAEALLANRINVRLWDPLIDQRLAWPIASAVVGDWMTLQEEAGQPGAGEWVLDQARVEAWVNGQNAKLGPEQYVKVAEVAPAVMNAITATHQDISVQVYHHDRQHTVASGETLSSIAVKVGMPYPWIQDANPGAGDKLRVGQVLTIPSADGLIPLPIVASKRIKISIGEQKMWAYENGALKWNWVVSTGIASSPTSPGVFQIQSHEPMAYAGVWDLFMPDFMGIYRPVPNQEFMNGFHGFPNRGGTQLLWTDSLGHPVTFGCILLDTTNAELLYNWADEGVIVEIVP